MSPPYLSGGGGGVGGGAGTALSEPKHATSFNPGSCPMFEESHIFF